MKSNLAPLTKYNPAAEKRSRVVENVLMLVALVLAVLWFLGN